ncbi:MAG: hypothetical protein H6865_06330 [Rhodospirillales bacterium]|nr:hypothetical protein [Alphaproteobacteria bacterium]MCB9987238.1 hypothetical protein [Rhodospirillales bacterium]USO07901.1 MAG: hypothetical protein H6866_01370 [Rhodospirillales bacterium]
MSTNDILIEGISKKAVAKADELNRAALHKTLGTADALRVEAFLGANVDAIDAFLKRGRRQLLSERLDELNLALSSRDGKIRKTALFSATRLAREFVRKSGVPFTDMDADGLKFKRVYAADIQDKMDNTAAIRAGGWGYARLAASNVGRMLGTALKLALLPHYTVKFAADSYAAAMSAFGIGKARRIAVLGGAAALAVGAAAVPVNAKQYAPLFTPKGMAMSAFKSACHDPRILNGSTLTAALATSIDHHDSKKMALFLSALEAGDANASPLAAYLVMMKETGAGNDLVSGNSSARGPRQSIDTTTLAWIHRYAQKTSAYKSAKERLAAGGDYAQKAEDRALTLAIDETVKNYSGKLVADVKNGRVPAYAFEAMNYAYQTVFGGQLFGQVLKTEAPYLNDARLDGLTMPQIAKEVGRYYAENHLLGAAGGTFLTYLVKHHPTVKMNDARSLERLYRGFGNRNAAFQENVGHYYVKVAKVNGLFRRGANVTAAEFADAIQKFVGTWAAKTLNGVERQLARGDTAAEICAADSKTRDALRDAVPETASTFEIGLRGLGVWNGVQKARGELGTYWTAALNMAKPATQPTPADAAKPTHAPGL